LDYLDEKHLPAAAVNREEATRPEAADEGIPTVGAPLVCGGLSGSDRKNIVRQDDNLNELTALITFSGVFSHLKTN